jgi:hypoxanthine phosphoribosyltransferase
MANADGTKSSSSPHIIIPDDYPGYEKETFLVSRHFKNDIERVLIPGGLIQDRIERLACDIAKDIGHESFIALCVLKGGYQFFSDLLAKIRQFYRFTSYTESESAETRDGSSSELRGPRQIRAEFIRVKSYEDDSSSGKVTITGIETLSALNGANVLIVEDIIDTGVTMVKLLDVLKDYNIKSLRVASLFLKRNPQSVGYVPHYVGFDIPNKFIIGYNLDYNEYFRELNHVCVISEEAKRKYAIKRTVVD